MKLIFDQNLSPILSERLRHYYPGSTHVREALSRRAFDDTIWLHAKSNGFVVVSKDADFRRLSGELGHPPKVIWIRSGNSSTDLVQSLLSDNWEEILAFEQDHARSIFELG